MDFRMPSMQNRQRGEYDFFFGLNLEKIMSWGVRVQILADKRRRKYFCG
jgi:hypothetical protein